MTSRIIDKKPYIDTTRDSLVDLTKGVYDIEFDSSIPHNYYITEIKDEGRIDLICYKLYNNTNFTHELMKLNNIKNPFSIGAGQMIVYYLDVEDMVNLQPRNDLEQSEIIKKGIDMKIKSREKDSSRRDVVNNRNKKDKLPPNIASEGYESVSINNGKMTITPSLNSNKNRKINEKVLTREELIAINTNKLKDVKLKKDIDENVISYK